MVCFGFMAYQPFLIIQCQILFEYVYIKYMISKITILIHTVKWSNSSISSNSVLQKSTNLNANNLFKHQSFVYI